VADPGASPRSATRIAYGAVPPPPAGQPTKRIAGDRQARVGTHLQGTEGLLAPGAESPKLRLTAGKVVPGTRYKILRWLGEGGMGVVYEAEHVDIERRVALKILRFDLSMQPRMVQVFKDEAKAAGRLGSHYLVEIFDFGELSDGRMFFAMELLDGHDLVPPDEQYSMDPSVLIPILRQVCKGLAVAHKANVVHRDVKPENVITTTSRDGREQVKIVDFGISAMLAAGPGHETGGVAGTPHYMAPEQIMGQPFDGRLDIYALGCMAYELLTGVPPFDGETVDELLHKQVTERPLPIRERRPEMDIPAALDAVIMRCLAKAPNDRYRDTAQLEAALCEAQIAAKIRTAHDDLPVPELPDEPERQAKIAELMPSPHRVVHKRSWLWPIVAGVSTAAAAGLGAFLLTRGPTEEERSVVDELESQAREAASRGDWLMPPPDAPEDGTAYTKITDLETLEGTAEAFADDVAHELRTEFSDTHVKAGDQLHKAGATDLARWEYLQAYIFDPENVYAAENSGVPPSLLGKYLDYAKTGEFPALDKYMLALADAQQTEDAEEKERKLAELANTELPPQAEELVAQVDPELQKRRRRSKVDRDEEPSRIAVAAVEPPAEAAPEEPIEIIPDSEIEPESEDAGSGRGRGKHKRRTRTQDPTELLGNAERDPVKADQLADQGLAALRSGQRSKAASLFNQAIAFDRSNAKALMGLSDVYFDTGQAQKAIIYAEKAVRASPANQTYRLKLGDAYFKVLRYKDALKQYGEAKKRGSGRADERIAKVKAKLGG
jgi:serine/threonine protein kinase